MAECGLCRREMLEADSCVEYKIQFNTFEKTIASPLPYGEESLYLMDNDFPDEPEGDCHDCGISPGGIHHPGCDWAECPRCGNQMLSHELGEPFDCDIPLRYVLTGERYWDVMDRTTHQLGGE